MGLYTSNKKLNLQREKFIPTKNPEIEEKYSFN